MFGLAYSNTDGDANRVDADSFKNRAEMYQQGKVMIIQLVVYWIFAADLSKRKTLNAHSKPIQQIIFTGSPKNKTIIDYILEQSKETTLQFSRNNKSIVTTYKWLDTIK